MKLIAILNMLLLLSLSAFAQKKEGVFLDTRDNKEYKTVRIGKQIWFAENFAYLPYVDTINISVYGYTGNATKKAKAEPYYREYGALYSWQMAKKTAKWVVCKISKTKI